MTRDSGCDESTDGRRRGMIAAAGALLGMALVGFAPAPAQAGSGQNDATVTVYKSPTCGCCTAWVDHLKENGFSVDVVERTDVYPEKQRFGVPERLYSCHTARIGDYTIEGHVPAADIRRLLTERPAVTGLSVPGMPHGSPGMETGRVDPYAVISFDDYGNTRIFNRY